MLVSPPPKGNQSTPEKNRDLLEELTNDVRSRLSDWPFAEGRDTMEEVRGRELSKQGLALAVGSGTPAPVWVDRPSARWLQVAGLSAHVDRGAVC